MKTKFFLILFVLVFATLGFKCGKSGGGNPDDGVFRGRLYKDQRAVTTKGATVFSRTAVNSQLLPLVDEGLDKLFDVSSRLNNYTTGLNHNQYNVYLFPRSFKCENAAFLVSADGSPYDQSEWDKDPRPGVCTLCAAGMMVDPNDYGMLVVDDVAIMPVIVRYEGEHLILYHNDRERFTATMYHIGSGHPIMPDDSGNRAVQKSFKELSITLQETVKFGEKTLPKGTQVCILLTK